MKRYILNLINEHKELTERVNKLTAVINSCNVDATKEQYKVCLDDYVLMRIQLEHMINYHDILSARLEKHGIVASGDKYFEDVTEVKEPAPVDSKTPGHGSDFDLDKQNENIQD